MAETAGSPSVARWRKIAAVCLGAVVAVNVAAFLVRAVFVAWAGPHTATTGFEEFNIYHVWKIVHGHALYEWPQKDHYTFTHYNPGFYHVYAAWAKLWRAEGAEIVNIARALTPFFALLGLVVQVHLMRRLVPADAARPSAWFWGLAILTWFGPLFGGWWVVSVRPDIGAVALALTGFALALRAQEGGGMRWWVAASLLFFAAWSFKQTVVWIYAGTIGQALLARVRWTHLAALVLPFAALAGAVILGSGEIYRYSLFVAPRLYQWFAERGMMMLGPAIAVNLFFWIFASWMLWSLVRTARTSLCARPGDAVALRLRATAFASVPPLAMGAVQVSAQGSNFNNLLEGFVLLSLLASAAWFRLLASAKTARGLALGAVLLAALIPVPATHLVLAARGIPYLEVRGISVGNAIKLNAAQLAHRRRVAAWMQSLPKPIWTRDVMLQMPWFSNDNRYPAFPLDHEFADVAESAGVLEGAGIDDWVRRRYFATLVLSPWEPLHEIAEEAGYGWKDAPRIGPWCDPFGLPGRRPLVWHRLPQPAAAEKPPAARNE